MGWPGTYTVTASAAGVATPAVFTLTNLAASSGAISLPGNVTVGPNQTLPFPVNLTVPAPSGGVTVSLSSSDTSKVAITPPSVFIAGGATAPAIQPTIYGRQLRFGKHRRVGIRLHLRQSVGAGERRTELLAAIAFDQCSRFTESTAKPLVARSCGRPDRFIEFQQSGSGFRSGVGIYCRRTPHR